MTDQVATWRMVVAVAIVAGLGVGLGAVAFSSEAAQRYVGPPSSVVAILPKTTPLAPSLSAVSTTRSTEDVADRVRSAVTAALEAWGSFAESGDLTDIDSFFDHAGPQWAVLEGEAGTAGVPFEASLFERSLEFTERTAIMTGTVTFVAGDESQLSDWEIELRTDDQGGWVIWSVREMVDG